MVEAQVSVAYVLDQKKHADCDQHCRAHQLASTALVAATRRSACAKQTPVVGKQTDTQKDENQRPETIHSKLENADGVEQKDYSQADQNHGSSRNLRGINLVAHAESLRQPEGIRSGLSQLECLGGPDCVNDLVKVKKSERDAQHHIDIPGQVRTEPDDH